MADNAAKILKQQKPDAKMLNNATDRSCRMILRENAVVALRWLWQSGDASQRTTVAARVAVWMNRDAEKITKRVFERETNRLKGEKK